MLTHTLGYPRIGASRGIKKACEGYWSGKLDEHDLQCAAMQEKQYRWQVQLDAGIDVIACNDFSFYDHVQDMTFMLGAIPDRYEPLRQHLSELDLYFAMCRGYQQSGSDVTAMEMTKWFDTNYHYLVPEFTPDQHFCYASRKCVEEFRLARQHGVVTPKPVLIGPVSYLLLGREQTRGFDRLDLIDRLLPVYLAILEDLHHAGCYWLQLDEPFLVTDLDDRVRDLYVEVYSYIRQHFPDFHIILATYFAGLGDNLQTAVSLPVDTLHVDAINGFDDLPELFESLPDTMQLSLGLIDGRNIWKNRIEEALGVLGLASKSLGKERLWVSSSCSLLHVPYDLELETPDGPLPSFLRPWLAFSRQKLDEIRLLADLLADEVSDPAFHGLAEHLQQLETRYRSPMLRNDEVRQRIADCSPDFPSRSMPFSERIKLQQERLQLPQLPVTLIGSLPQTAELRELRKRFRNKVIDNAEYKRRVRSLIADAIAWQEDAGIDVLVHGEFERNDMVEYFGEHLDGFAFTANGWVQSYGSRAVKPPIIYGDVSRKKPITVEWSVFAQSLTEKPVKGMLTGPVTMLQWSFVRDDQPRSETAMQIALALSDEVLDLERAGIGIIQIDEPGIREGLPLRRKDRDSYLDWAVRAFVLTSVDVDPATQIHTHLCYADYRDILDALVQMDADVLTIETARSGMKVIEAFASKPYPNQLGPGIYDIHSPRIPSAKEMRRMLVNMLRYFGPDQIWVNPDCGLKTRSWDEVRPSITHMVKAATSLRLHHPRREMVEVSR